MSNGGSRSSVVLDHQEAFLADTRMGEWQLWKCTQAAAAAQAGPHTHTELIPQLEHQPNNQIPISNHSHSSTFWGTHNIASSCKRQSNNSDSQSLDIFLATATMPAQ